VTRDDAPGEDEPSEPSARASVDLGKPKRTLRTITVGVMSLTALLAAWLMWSLRGEAAYAVGPASAIDLGALAAADLAPHDNRFVRVSAELEGASSVGYRRWLDRDPQRIALAVAGDGDGQRWVSYGVPPSLAGPRFVPPSLVAGRLVRADQLGVRFGGIRRAIEELSGKSAKGAWVVVDGEDPAGLGWVVGLEALLLLFIGFNLISVARVLRRIPAEK
jgi:hypothetical protein